jgi:hypothetical protein
MVNGLTKWLYEFRAKVHKKEVGLCQLMKNGFIWNQNVYLVVALQRPIYGDEYCFEDPLSGNRHVTSNFYIQYFFKLSKDRSTWRLDLPHGNPATIPFFDLSAFDEGGDRGGSRIYPGRPIHYSKNVVDSTHFLFRHTNTATVKRSCFFFLQQAKGCKEMWSG